MLRSVSCLRRNAVFAVLVPFAALLAAACSDDSGAPVNDDEGGIDTGAPSGDDAGAADDGPGVALKDAGDSGARDGGSADGGDGGVQDTGVDAGTGVPGDSGERDSGGEHDAADSGEHDAGDSGGHDAGDGGEHDAGDGGAHDGGVDAGTGVHPGDGGDGGAHDAGDAGLVVVEDGGDSGADAEVDASDGGSGPPRMGPAPVILGSSTDLSTPAAYVLLAKTAITNVTGSLITGGDVGLSPAAASFITGFSLVADSTNVFSTSASVVGPGKVYASTYAPPTPMNLTTAILGMQLAYSDAAGRSNPDFLDLNGGDIGGMTLAPGLYAWGTGVTIPNDVTLSGAANDVWIFQVSNDLDMSSAKSVILARGAQARNVFWQIAGQATIHANARFEGIILSKTSITLQTTASMHGRALAQSLVALDNNAVTAP
jgi:Ice-binding-like